MLPDPSHERPQPRSPAPGPLIVPGAEPRSGETGRQRSRSGSCRPALRLRCQRVAGPGTGPFGSCVHCPPARRQSWARKPIAGPPRPSRRGSPTGLLSSFASVVLPQSALTPSTATRRRKAPAALCRLSSLSTTPTASVAFLARVVPCGREAAVARGPGHHAGQAPAEADAGSVVSPTCSTTSPSGRPFSVLSRLFQTYFSWVFI